MGRHIDLIVNGCAHHTHDEIIGAVERLRTLAKHQPRQNGLEPSAAVTSDAAVQVPDPPRRAGTAPRPRACGRKEASNLAFGRNDANRGSLPHRHNRRDPPASAGRCLSPGRSSGVTPAEACRSALLRPMAGLVGSCRVATPSRAPRLIASPSGYLTPSTTFGRITGVSFDEPTSLRLVGEALSLAHRVRDDVQKITVRDVKVIDQSLTVEVLDASEDPIKLRGQAASVMGGLSGLDLPDLFPAIRCTHFAVRLSNSRGEEQFWIISSPEVAKFAATDAVRWLANSCVRDNTPAYRRSMADRQISMLEVAMRDLLDKHWLDALGGEYPSNVITETMLRDLQKSARRDGEDEADGRTLLDYTYLPQLAKLFCSEQLLRDHGCLEDPAQVEEDMKALNKIRRNVAHNRTIGADQVAEARRIAGAVLSPVGRHHPELINDFLTERWDEAVASIFKQMRSAGFAQDEPPTAGEVDAAARLECAATMLEDQLDAARQGRSALQNLVVPHTRQRVHDAANEAFDLLFGAIEEYALLARSPHLTTAKAHAAHLRHAEAMRSVRAIGKQIEAILVYQTSPDG